MIFYLPVPSKLKLVQINHDNPIIVPGWDFGTKVVKIFNSGGVLVEERSFISNNNYYAMHFDLSKQANGVYFVHLLDKYTHTEAVGKLFIHH